jgi:hypothetical protein
MFMKHRSIIIMLIISLLLMLTNIPSMAIDANDVTIVNAMKNENTVDVTLTANCNQVVVQLWAGDNMVGFVSVPVSVQSEEFTASIPMIILKNGLYVVKAANYDGGSYAVDELQIGQSLESPAKATLLSKSSSTILLNAVSGCEYSIDAGATWQDSAAFGNLSANTLYTFTQRIKETATDLSSNSSVALEVKTDAVAGSNPPSASLPVVIATPTPEPVLVPSSTPSPSPTISTSQSLNPPPTLKNVVVAEIKANAIDDVTTGVSQAIISSADMTEMILKAKTADVSNTEQAVMEVKVAVSTGTKSVTIELPQALFAKIGTEADSSVRIEAGIGSLTFDVKAIAEISDKAAGDIRISISQTDVKSLASKVQEELKGHPVFSFNVSSGNEKIMTFGGSSVIVSVPYILLPGESAESIVVYYVSDDGILTPVTGRYNAALGTVVFETTHFSSYTVVNNDVVFSDVASHDDYSKAVRFIAARKITSGVGNTKYGPGLSITRADFVVMLLKAYGMSPEPAGTSNFSDAGNTYFTGYLAAARRLGITTGIGGGRFAPYSSISNQETLTLIYRLLTILKKPLATGSTELTQYLDSQRIPSWAKASYTAFIKAGVIGKTTLILNPAGKATRSDVAVLLYDLLK